MRHLLLTGGSGHDVEGTSAALVELLEGLGATTTVVDHPAAAVDALRVAEDGVPRWDLVSVNTLRSATLAARDGRRAEHGVDVLGPDELSVIEQHVLGGGGLLAMHTAVICFDAAPTWRRLVGGVWHWGRSGHPPVGQVRVEPTAAAAEHPVTEGCRPFVVEDELYRNLDLDTDLVPLLTGTTAGRTHPVLWARHHGRGRVVTDLLGHGPASLRHPAHGALIAHAAGWAARTTVPSTSDR